MRLGPLVLGAVLLLSSSGGAAEDTLTPEKTADIKKLLELTGSKKLAVEFATALAPRLFAAVKASRPSIPDRALDVMQRELVAVLSENADGLIDSMVPLYARAFTHQEIKDLLTFYGTATGKKAVELMPALMREGMRLGETWAQSLSPEIRRRIDSALRREGVIPGGKSPRLDGGSDT
ncbi:MAG TPA: DUF2059 domain-containing protein [Myxococcaceae bacterium]|nr:DUF2059 domain-containing protein [Myxococcaceae bacterium]